MPEGARRRPLGSTELKRLHREWRRRTAGRLALVLDDVQGPYNVGSIVRTAAAFGVDRLWTAGTTAHPTGPKAQKTAMGTQRYLVWDVVESVTDALEAARADAYAVIGMELAEGAVPLPDLDVGERDVCLVVGHEDRGLSREALAACDAVAFIPQVGKVGSLNVATATAIALYELRRRAWTT
jgi:tRNA (guanosine-2'-O-)-methyltransferase